MHSSLIFSIPLIIGQFEAEAIQILSHFTHTHRTNSRGMVPKNNPDGWAQKQVNSMVFEHPSVHYEISKRGIFLSKPHRKSTYLSK